MGLLDNLEKQFAGIQQGDALRSVSGLIANNGGLSGVISRFQQSGLGQHAQSWIGNGDNLPITGDHVGQVFGSSQVQQVAQELGINSAHASSVIANLLPNVINKLTPQGQMVSDGEAQQGLASLLTKGLSSLFGPKP